MKITIEINDASWIDQITQDIRDVVNGKTQITMGMNRDRSIAYTITHEDYPHLAETKVNIKY